MRKRIAVVGLGTMGSMALWHLSKRQDVEAIGIEQFGVVHGYGAFSGESRLFRMAYHEGSKYVPLLREARAGWYELQIESGRRLFYPYGVLSIGREQDSPLQRLLHSVETAAIPHERLNAVDMRRRFPGMDIRDNEVGVIDLLGGALRPELAVFSALEQAQRHGARIYEHEETVDIIDTPTGVQVRTTHRAIAADAVIVASGAWTSRLFPWLSNAVEVRKILLTWFLPKKHAYFVPESLPCFIRDRDGFHVFGAPSVDGYSVKIAGGDIWGGPETSRVEEADLRMVPQEITEFGLKVAQLFPGIHPEPQRFSVHFDTFTADKTPLIGRTENIIIATGFSGHGFKMAPAIGRYIGALAMGENPPMPFAQRVPCGR